MINEQNEKTWPPILFDKDLSAILGVSVSTLREMRKRTTWAFRTAELPRIGRKPRWSRDAVLAVINGSSGVRSRSRVA